MEDIHNAVEKMVNEAATLLVQGIPINMRHMELWARDINISLIRCEYAQEAKKKKWWRRFIREAS